MSFSCQDGSSSSSSSSTEKKKQRGVLVPSKNVVMSVAMLLLLGAAVIVAILVPHYDGPSKKWSSSSLKSSFDTHSHEKNVAAGRRRELLQEQEEEETSTAAAFLPWSPRHQSSSSITPTRHGSFQVLDKVPHDPQAFTQGLQMLNETHYYESLGLYGESAVRLVELKTAKTIMETTMGRQWFGEGLCQYSVPVHSNGQGLEQQEQQQQQSSSRNQRLIQITWNEQQAFVYDAKTLKELNRISYTTSNGEGWGITLDTSKNVLYVTDGSAYLHTWNVPGSDDGRDSSMLREVSHRVVVYKTLDNGMTIPVQNLNELEYDSYAAAAAAAATTVNDENGGGGSGGTLLANVWQSDIILRINPETGHVTTIYDMTSLFPYSERPMSSDVLNGIAAIPNHPNEYWVTGKKWPWMFRVRLS